MSIEQAVIAVCDRCDARSMPMDPTAVPEFQRRHDAQHARDDRRERMAGAGHKIGQHMHFVDNDDSSGYAFCSCGWRSRDVRLPEGMGDDHLAEVERDVTGSED